MLGRPTHLLDRFGATLKQHLDQFFATSLGRRHGVAVAVRNVSFASHAPELESRPWRRETADRAAIGVHIERALLLTLLELRYGPAMPPVTPPAAAAAEAGDAQPAGDGDGETASAPSTPIEATAADAPPIPETTTERRLAERLAGELARTVARAIPFDARPDGETPPPPDGGHARRTHLFAICTIEGAASRTVGEICFALDPVWQQRLFDHLKSSMSRARSVRRERSLPSTRLRLKLTAQLMEMSVPFGDVLRLRPGTVLPVRLHAPARVMTHDAQLFTASIAEHNGKLCLTSFVYVE